MGVSFKSMKKELRQSPSQQRFCMENNMQSLVLFKEFQMDSLTLAIFSHNDVSHIKT